MLREAGTPRHGMPTLQAAVDACAGDGGRHHQAGLQERPLGPALPAAGEELRGRRGLPPPGGSRSGAHKYTDAVEAAKREAGVPFKWVACDVRGCYPLIRDDEIVEMVEVQERPLHDCLRSTGSP